MHNLKFRYWDKVLKHFIFSDEFSTLCPTGGSSLYQRLVSFFEKARYYSDGPVEMWTGLLDKDQVEVYQGDMVWAENHHPSLMEIKFIEGGFCAKWGKDEDYPIDINHFYPSTGCQFKVCGHIHDWPMTKN